MHSESYSSVPVCVCVCLFVTTLTALSTAGKCFMGNKITLLIHKRIIAVTSKAVLRLLKVILSSKF